MVDLKIVSVSQFAQESLLLKNVVEKVNGEKPEVPITPSLLEDSIWLIKVNIIEKLYHDWLGKTRNVNDFKIVIIIVLVFLIAVVQ